MELGRCFSMDEEQLVSSLGSSGMTFLVCKSEDMSANHGTYLPEIHAYQSEADSRKLSPTGMMHNIVD
jgi:hypothetical protein